jgi:hypothetical protein
MRTDRTFHTERVKGTIFIALLSIFVTAYYLIWRFNTLDPEAMGFSCGSCAVLRRKALAYSLKEPAGRFFKSHFPHLLHYFCPFHG